MPIDGYNPMQDPWYGASGNGPSASPGGGGDVDLSGIESRLGAVEGDVGTLGDNLDSLQGDVTGHMLRLSALETRPKVFVGEVPVGEPGPYVQFEPSGTTIDISVDDGAQDAGEVF